MNVVPLWWFVVLLVLAFVLLVLYWNKRDDK